MASSAAVISLMQTIESLQNSPHFPDIFLNYSSREIIKSAHNEVMSLKEILLLFDRSITIKGAFSLARRANAIETIESLLRNHFPSEYEIIQFADEHLLPLQEFLRDGIIGKRANDIVSDGQLIRKAANKFEDHHAVENIAIKFQKSLVFPENVEEGIKYFAITVTRIKEYSEDLREGNLDAIFNELRELDYLLTRFIRTADKVFEEVLQRLNRTRSKNRRKRLNALDDQIREATCELEDTIESHFSNQFLSQSDQSHSSSFSLDLQEVDKDIESFIHLIRKLKQKYIIELFYPLPDNDDDVTSRTDFGEIKSKMVGFSDDFCEIVNQLKSRNYIHKTLSLYGMAGIGKTTLARKVFEDPSISNWFDLRVWVAIRPQYRLRDIMLGILAQVKPSVDKTFIAEGNEKLAEYLLKCFKGRRYLIVLDDVWDTQLMDKLHIMLLPLDSLENHVMVTTRLGRVASWFKHTMRFLNKEESWDLLREKVFGEEPCSPQLEKVGKKIAENCEGLPLTIITVGDLLSKAERTPEYWNKIVLNRNSIFVDAYDRIMKVLLPSYNYLPQHLKACFLYMGVFPQNYEITRSELVKLWSAEGFLDQHASFMDIDKIIDHLVDDCLLISHQKSSTFKIKTCRLHSSFWHVCKREAWKNKFSHVINSYADGLEEGIKSQRRLCIHNNSLFGVKYVHNSMASISTARSLLCSGPFHLYPVPICFGLKLLRILDARSIRFYEFPVEVLKLIQLKYFALTYNGELPRSISKLWNLQFLIISRHLSIQYNGSHTYLPMEIWDMKELKHFQVMGSNLPNPCDGTFLPKLVTLLDVSALDCTKEVLEKLPNLEKLGIRIELAPHDAEPLSCFDHISHLHRLESLKCVVVNPILWPDALLPPPLSILPSRLRKLTLSGLGYPWEDFSKIGWLPNLEVLKLRCYAFRGPMWEFTHMGFWSLKLLLIEDCDLVHWKVTNGCFHRIGRRCLKHCYKLEEIPWEIVRDLREIEVVDCGRLVMACAKQAKEDRNFDADIRSSYMG